MNRQRVPGFGGVVLTTATVVAACSGSDATPSAASLQPAATSVTTAAPAPLANPTPLPTFDGVTPIVLRAGDPVPFPDGLVLYALDGNWEGPSPALRRYYRDPSGTMRIDELLVSTEGGSDNETRAVVGAVTGPRVADIAVGLCYRVCYAEARPLFVALSADGGITWTDLAALDIGDWGTIAAVDGARVWIREYQNPNGRNAVYPLDDPSAALLFTDQFSTGSSILAGERNGEPFVAALGTDRRTVRRLDAGGQALVPMPLPPGIDVEERSLSLVRYDGATVVQASWRAGAPGETYLGLFDLESGRLRNVVHASRRDGVDSLDVTAWLTPTLAIGRASFVGGPFSASQAPPNLGVNGPALIDLQAGTISPIEELLPRMSYKPGGPVPIAAVVGNFARVVNAGTCLNVREAPAADAPVLACYADRVLLPVRAGAETADGTRWVAVSTLDGRDGWAARDYLELAGP